MPGCGQLLNFQEESFNKLKEKICSPRVLAFYDTLARTKISADTSAYGLGAVLLQQHQYKWRLVAFASCALNETEIHCTQIEEAALALTWALERFSKYVLGKVIQLKTDHKPLIPVLGQKTLDLLTHQVLWFRFHVLCNSNLPPTTCQGNPCIQ